MIMINIHEAKTHLSRYLEKLKNGERILLCKRNIPIAEIVPLSRPNLNQKRPIGLAKGNFIIPPAFFKPLPQETLKMFNSEGK